MSNSVFANGMEVSCKASDGKSICAFPDVCFTPPQTPATPPGVPIPYPNTALASDCSDGTTTVKIGGEESSIKDTSCFKTSSGDEAGSAPKKGAVTSKTKGKAYFSAWSMDVKFEGLNVPRHVDLTTHNHSSKPPNAMITAFIAKLTTGNEKSCSDEKKDCEDKCKGAPAHSSGKGLDCSGSPGCAKAKACCLQAKDKDKQFCCHPDKTGHHLVEVHCFTPTGGRSAKERLSGFSKYDDEKAPCVCASQDRGKGSHGVMHAVQGQVEGAYNSRAGAPHRSWPGGGPLLDKTSGRRGPATSKWRYRDARDAGVLAHKLAFPHCNPECIRKQLDNYHKDVVGCDETTPLRSDPGAETRDAGEVPRGRRMEMRALLAGLAGIGAAAGAF